MTCKHCENKSPFYDMECIGCVAREVRGAFYKSGTDIVKHVENMAKKHGFKREDLAKKIREFK